MTPSDNYAILPAPRAGFQNNLQAQLQVRTKRADNVSKIPNFSWFHRMTWKLSTSLS